MSQKLLFIIKLSEKQYALEKRRIQTTQFWKEIENSNNVGWILLDHLIDRET